MSNPREQAIEPSIEAAGCRVLVVEDETLIAVLIEQTLEAMHCEVVGPAAKLETALQLVLDEGFDIAILDVTVRGGKVYPVAELLLARGIPFVLASGYGDWALPKALRDQRRLLKPFTSAMLEQEVRVLCAQAAELKTKQ
jgi:two-component SAPR family response regulator